MENQALELRIEALELELRKMREFVKAMNTFTQQTANFTLACDEVTQELDTRLKRVERVISPKIAEDV